MEYIVSAEDEGINFQRYVDYIKSIKSNLPDHVYSFASDSRYFDLNSPMSLHDSWLESLIVKEISGDEGSKSRSLAIQLILLGPFHDRRICILYTGVTKYLFDTPPQSDSPRNAHIAHGDLYTHEVRLGNEGLLIHEILFERGSRFLIECKDFTHSEEILKPDC
jgi:hypothetical protein